jgi:hypothetical protein
MDFSSIGGLLGGGDATNNPQQPQGGGIAFFRTPSFQRLALSLIAGGGRMTDTERNKLFSDAIGGFDPATDIARENQAQQTALTSQVAQSKLAGQQALLERLKNPDFAKQLGVDPNILSSLDAETAANVIQNKLTQDPAEAEYRRLRNDALKNPKPEWRITGRDENGQPVYNLVSGDGNIITPPDANPKPKAVDPDLHGDAFLSTLDQQEAARVKALAEGKLPFPTGSALNRPQNARIAERVLQYDPTFDAANTQTRFKTLSEFKTGGANSPAATIVAGNTAITHLGHMADSFEKMGNGQIPLWNSITNKASQATGGGTAFNEFENAKSRFIEEATKFYRGTGGTEEDIRRASEMLSSASSPPQMRAAIRTQTELMRGKVDALQQRWHAGVGPNVPDFEVFTPETRATLDAIEKRYRESEGGSSAPPVAPPVKDQRLIDQTIANARTAIKSGKSRDAVIQSLRANGYPTEGL